MEFGVTYIHELAASYAFGLAKNHGFIDANKRAAFLACAVFLELNGYRLMAAEADAALAFLSVAAGEMSETELASWLRERTFAL